MLSADNSEPFSPLSLLISPATVCIVGLDVVALIGDGPFLSSVVVS